MSFALSPATLLGASYGGHGIVHLLQGPKKVGQQYFGTELISDAHACTMKFSAVTGIAAGAVLLLADKASTTKDEKRDLNLLVAAASLAHGGLAEYSRRKDGLDDTQANILSILSLGIGGYAAFEAFKLIAEE